MIKKVLKWTGVVVAGLLGLLVLVFGGVYFAAEARVNKVYDVRPAALSLPADEASLAEGKRVFTTRGCSDCHNPDGSGKVMEEIPSFLGYIVPTNLTGGKGGVGAVYKDTDWDRAIRHGLDPEGKPLMVMPSEEYAALDDVDTAALIAYLKSLPPVDNELPPSTIGPLGRVLLVTGGLSALPAEAIDHSAPHLAAVDRTVSVEYGAYLAATCTGCHGQSLSGGPIPGVPGEPPYPSNLTPNPETGLGGWQEADFVQAIRTGQRPDGSTINPQLMPWPAFSQMTDGELSALWLYLESIPAQPFGNR